MCLENEACWRSENAIKAKIGGCAEAVSFSSVTVAALSVLLCFWNPPSADKMAHSAALQKNKGSFEIPELHVTFFPLFGVR